MRLLRDARRTSLRPGWRGRAAAASSFFFGIGNSPSRCACLRAALRARTHGLGLFADALLGRLLVGTPCLHFRGNTPSRCIFFFRTRSGLLDIVVAYQNLQFFS